jgi:hypothetical protein
MRFRGLCQGQQADNDFAAEVKSHVAMHTEDGIRAGLSLDEARRQALVRLGGVEQVRQAYRERRTLPLIESLVSDAIEESRPHSRRRPDTCTWYRGNIHSFHGCRCRAPAIMAS